MYKVLIVDDEEWVVQSLVKGIPWESKGFTVAGWAHNGREGLEKLVTLEPDLVVTDIRMPDMGGLDLMKQAREERLPVEFIVVSGYAEFAYAQKALQYGVIGYCLKPIEDSEMDSVLERAFAILERRSSRGKTVGDDVIGMAEEDETDPFGDRLRRAGFRWDDGTPKYILAYRGTEDILSLTCRPVYSSPVGVRYRIWVLSAEGYHDAAPRISEIARASGHLFGVSRPIDDSGPVERGIQEALIAANQRFIHWCDGIFEYPMKPDNPRLRELLHALETALGATDARAVSGCFSALRSILTSGYTAKHASFVCNTVHYLLSAIGMDDQEPVYHYEELIGLYPDAAFMLRNLEEIVLHLLTDRKNGTSAAGEEPDSGSAAERAVEFVDTHYLNDISLKALSERFFVSPSHLCRSFKKITGEPLTAYVTRKRIEYACSLLTQSDVPVSDVAEMSGYDNYFYFARVFKRIMSATPTGYRSKMTGRE